MISPLARALRDAADVVDNVAGGESYSEHQLGVYSKEWRALAKTIPDKIERPAPGAGTIQRMIDALVALEKGYAADKCMFDDDMIGHAETLCGDLPDALLAVLVEARDGKPMIERYLDLSTSHISPGDAATLNRFAAMQTGSPLVIYPTRDYGWFIYAAPGDEETYAAAVRACYAHDMTRAFLLLLESAHNAGCAFLRLDRDGPEDPEREAFSWEDELAPARPDDAVEALIDAATNHGNESEPDHEVGDLQQMLRLAWATMSDGQRQRMLASEEAGDFLAEWGARDVGDAS